MATTQDVEAAGKNIPGSDAGAPLLHHEPKSPNSNKESVWMVWVCTLVAVCGSFEFGACMGYSAPTQSGIIKSLHLSLSEFSVFGSMVTIGAMIGAVTSGYVAEFIGRKGAMRVSAVVCIVGWLAVYFAAGPLSLDIGRFLTGYGIGVFSYVVPVFIAEIAPKNLRGCLTTLNQLLICTGLSVVYILGTFLTWRTLVLAGIIPCVILLLGLFFIPESPRWLAKTGHQKEFEVALQVLRGKEADISHEAAEIQDYIENLKCLPKARMQDLFQRRYLRSVIVAVGLMSLQQLGGVNGIVFYASEIFVSAGFSSGDLGTIIMGCIQAPITALGSLLMDRSGRRQLLMLSASGTSLGTFLAAIAFYMKGHGLLPEVYPILALTGILVYMGSFSLGMGPVPWVIMSEIFPLNIKGTGGSLVNLAHWLGSLVISYSFNFLTTWSASGTFFIFFAINAATILFVIKVVPETKGRTLEEIQASMNAA